MFIGEIQEVGIIEPLEIPEPLPIETGGPEAHPAEEPVPS